MVDLALLQIVSYIVGALGVCVAAFYYSMNLRETTRNRRATLTQLMLETFSSVEGFKQILKLYDMKWTDFNDYMSKYDSTVNPENAAIRHHIWDAFDIIGNQWREGILDKNTIYNVCGDHCVSLWIKFKQIVEEYRSRELNKMVWSSWEELAREMEAISLSRDSGYVEKIKSSIVRYQK